MFHNWKDEDIIKFYEDMLSNLPNIDNQQEIKKDIQNKIQEIKHKIKNSNT